MRTTSQEKIWVNEKTNFHYIVRGVQRVPEGSEVYIRICSGMMTDKQQYPDFTFPEALLRRRDGGRRHPQ